MHRHGSPRRTILCLITPWILAATLAGCMSTDTVQPAQLPAGINDNFLSDDLDVDQWVERFEGESRAVYAEREAIVRALQLSPGDAIADIGAGTGFFSLLFAQAVGPEGEVYAVEISPRFLEHLRKTSRDQSTENLNVVEGTDRSAMLPTDSVDAAFICDVYHHFEYPNDSLSSLRDAIRPGGSLYLIDFNRIPGETPEWLLEHVRAGRDVFQAEIEAAGFRFSEEIELEGLGDNYFLRFENSK
jgi:SAM-dependent methyltransferase